MAGDYLPRQDGAFWDWTQTFHTYAAAHVADLGLTVDDMTDLATKMAAFQTVYNANNVAQQNAQAAKQAKDAGRVDLEGWLRATVRRIQAHPTVTDEHRAGLGITVPDSEPTKVAVPETRPVAVVDTSKGLRHEIRFFDESTPNSKAKPTGAMGCEIWVKIGAAPADPSECQFLALDTASPYVATFAGADAGKTAYYMLRWVSKTGEKGPWSTPEPATIAA